MEKYKKLFQVWCWRKVSKYLLLHKRIFWMRCNMFWSSVSLYSAQYIFSWNLNASNQMGLCKRSKTYWVCAKFIIQLFEFILPFFGACHIIQGNGKWVQRWSYIYEPTKPMTFWHSWDNGRLASVELVTVMEHFPLLRLQFVWFLLRIPSKKWYQLHPLRSKHAVDGKI